MNLLKNTGLIVLALLSSQFFMYYYIDDVMVIFSTSSAPYIFGRLLLGFIIFAGFKFLLREFEINPVYVDLAMICYLILLVSVTLLKEK